MAERNLDFDPIVTNVTPQMPDHGFATGIADFADQVATMSANAKALNASTQSSLAFRQADAQYRQDAASNPNDPEALAKLQATRSEITSRFGQQVPAIASREYMMHMMEVQQNSDKLNELWGMQQSVKNAHADLQTSANSQVLDFVNKGRQFGADGGDITNIDAVLSLEQNQKALTKFATPVLGESQTLEFIKNSNRNNVQGFISGLAESHPEMAALALQQDGIKTHFTSQEIDNMGALIKKTQKTQELLQSYTTTNNSGSQLAGLVNDPNSTYAVKSNQIYSGIADGSIDSKIGHAALNVLHSQKIVDAQTDSAVMTGIHDQVSDLNSRAKLAPDDYLMGVQGIQKQVYDAMVNGTLTKDDGSDTLKWIDSYTHTKMSSATNTAGMEMHNAQKMFSDLSPEYRDVAVRNLFYATRDQNGHDQKLTQQQYQARAAIVKDQVNNQRRQNALSTLKTVSMSDDDIVKAAGFTMKDVEQTSQESGASQQDVIKSLRIRAITAERMKGRAVKSIKASADDSSDAVTAPEKDYVPSDQGGLESEMNQ